MNYSTALFNNLFHVLAGLPLTFKYRKSRLSTFEIWKSHQGTKMFQYCTCPAGRVSYNFHLSCKHMHMSFKNICNKEDKGVLCYMTFLSNSSQSTRSTG